MLAFQLVLCILYLSASSAFANEVIEATDSESAYDMAKSDPSGNIYVTSESAATGDFVGTQELTITTNTDDGILQTRQYPNRGWSSTELTKVDGEGNFVSGQRVDVNRDEGTITGSSCSNLRTSSGQCVGAYEETYQIEKLKN